MLSALMRVAAPLLAAGYGLYFLYSYWRGTLYFYIHPAYIVPTLVTGVVLVALAAAAGRSEHRPSRSAVAALALPLVLGLLLPASPLGVGAALSRGLEASPLGRLEQPAEFRVETRPESYTVKDWVGALRRDPEPSRHAGKPVRVVGFVFRDKGVPEGWFVVARFVVQCCAVDATPVGIPVRAPGRPPPEAGAWVRVAGAWVVAEVGGERRAVVDAAAVEAVPRPEQPYLY
jgi:uncharacterized repeat protein (TIGR03943 family)